MPPPNDQAKLTLQAVLDWTKMAGQTSDPKFQRTLKDFATRATNIFEQHQKQSNDPAVREHGLIGKLLFGPKGPGGMAAGLAKSMQGFAAGGFGMGRIPIFGGLVTGMTRPAFGGGQHGLIPRAGAAAGGAAIAAGALGIATLIDAIFKDLAEARQEMQTAGLFGRRGIGQRGGRFGFPVGETIGFAANLARATGTDNALTSVLAAQRGYNIGNEAIGLLGGVGRRAGRSSTDREAYQILGDVLGSAFVTKLERGRLGEALTGTHDILERQALGVGANTGGIAMIQAILGTGNAAFRGGPGFQAVGALDLLAKGGQGGVGSRAAAMMAAGLGQGVGFFEAQKRMQAGLFGDRGGLGGSPERLQALMNQYRRMSGGNRNVMEMMMSRGTGLPEITIEKMLNAFDKGKSPKQIQRLLSGGIGDFDPEAKRIRNMFPEITKLDDIQRDLAAIGKDIITSHFVQEVITGLRDLVRLGREFADKMGVDDKPETPELSDAEKYETLKYLPAVRDEAQRMRLRQAVEDSEIDDKEIEVSVNQAIAHHKKTVEIELDEGTVTIDLTAVHTPRSGPAKVKAGAKATKELHDNANQGLHGHSGKQRKMTATK